MRESRLSRSYKRSRRAMEGRIRRDDSRNGVHSWRTHIEERRKASSKRFELRCPSYRRQHRRNRRDDTERSGTMVVRSRNRDRLLTVKGRRKAIKE